MACVLVAAAVAFATSASGAPPAAGGPRSRAAWIVSATAMRHVAALDSGLARYFFDTPHTFVIGGKTSRAPRPEASAAIRTVSFTNERTLDTAIVTHRLRPGTRAVIYDDEHWSLTPVDQQTDPGRFYRLAAQVAHRYGLLLIATPGTDLVQSIAPGTSSAQRYAEFLRLGVAGAAARYADVYEVQAQGSEADLARYVTFVQAASAQAERAHPGVELLAGISTNSLQGGMEAASQLLEAVLATRAIVDGYWLNDPAHGSACPRCSGPYPRAAVEFLRDLHAS